MPDTVASRCIQQIDGALNVVLGEKDGLLARGPETGDGGEMDNAVDGPGLPDLFEPITVEDVLSC